jgi:hypothetical protein
MFRKNDEKIKDKLGYLYKLQTIVLNMLGDQKLDALIGAFNPEFFHEVKHILHPKNVKIWYEDLMSIKATFLLTSRNEREFYRRIHLTLDTLIILFENTLKEYLGDEFIVVKDSLLNQPNEVF